MKKTLLISILFIVKMVSFAQVKTATGFNNPFNGTFSTNPSTGAFDDGQNEYGWYVDDINNISVSQNNELNISLNNIGQYTGFGMYVYTYSGGSGIDKIDISSNPKIQFKAKSDQYVKLQILIQDNETPKGETKVDSIEIPGDNTYRTYTLDFSGAMQGTVNLTKINGPRFQTTANSTTASIAIDDLKMGSAVTVAGVLLANSINYSKLYPNPSSGKSILELNVLEFSRIKIIVSDIYGREKKLISEDDFTKGNFQTEIDLSSLEQGIYLINCYVNNNPAFTKTLVIK